MQKNNTAEFLRKHILCFFLTMLCFALYFPGVYPLSLILGACSTNILSTEVGSSRYEWIPAWPQKKNEVSHVSPWKMLVFKKNDPFLLGGISDNFSFGAGC